jgi:hypothetical protein
MTLVGEQSITLSQVRNNEPVLHVLYTLNTNLILLDDHLSSVDADVDHHVFSSKQFVDYYVKRPASL